MFKNKKFIILIIIILGAISIGLYGYYLIAKKELTPVTVRLKWLHQAQFAGMYVAKEKGFYEKAGLSVTLKEAEFEARPSVDEVADGDVHFAIVDPIELLKKIDEGLKVKAVSVIYQNSPVAFGSLKESGIETPNDLRGRVVGIPGENIQTYTITNALLGLYDVKPDEVTFKNVGFNTAENIIQKTVDIIGLYRIDQPYLLDKEGVKYNLLLPEAFGFSNYDDILFTSNQLIDENPDLVKGFVQATIAGWNYAIEHPDEAVTISLEYSTDPQYKDRARQEFIFKESMPLIKPTGGQPIGSMNFITWHRLYSVMESSGLIENIFDVADAYTTEFLK